MKTIAVLLLSVILFGQSKGQSAGRSLEDTLLRMYNSHNYAGIYNLGSNEWKLRHDTAGLRGWLSWMLGQTGPITSSAPISDTGKFMLIRWNGQRKVTAFMLQTETDGGFNDFYFAPFKQPLSAEELRGVRSDNPLRTSLDSAVHKIMAAFMVYNKATGVSIGVIRNGEPFTYNYGTVDKRRQELPTSHSYYEIGSIIKTFTSLLLSKAVTEHKLSLQDDVRKFLDGDYSNLQYQGHPLRLVDLASYTSALPAYQILRPFDESTTQAVAAFFKTYAIDSFLTDVKKATLDTVPGVRYTYSTAGFNLLAYVLGRVYHKPFPELVRERITGPMGMHDTKLGLSAQDRHRFPTGYDSKGDEQPDITGPLDSLDLLHSTVDDMLIYLKQQIAEKDPAIRLSHEQFSNAPHNEAGLGWFLYQTPYGKAIGKGGNSVHMSCRSWTVPEKEAGVVCFANNNDTDWGDLVDDLMAILVTN